MNNVLRKRHAFINLSLCSLLIIIDYAQYNLNVNRNLQNKKFI